MSNILAKLREEMSKSNIDAYIVFTCDYHMSEYISDYFKTLSYISGFTGSNGTLVVTKSEAALFTDGRYFLQAKKELQGSGISLMETDEDADLIAYLRDRELNVIAADGRTISAKKAMKLMRALNKSRFDFYTDIISKVYESRPPLPCSKVISLDVKYAGATSAQKLGELRKLMDIEGITKHVITSLDDIAWLFNIRGGDIAYTPLVLSYAVIEMGRATLFVDERKLDQSIRACFRELGVNIEPYEAVYESVKDFSADDRTLLSSEKVNYSLYSAIESRSRISDESNPTTYAKCVKNETECENLRAAHVKDAVAMVRLLCSLSTSGDISVFTESDVAGLCSSLREEQQGFVSPSFAPIVGYGANGAIVHYQPKHGEDARLNASGLLLIDSGGQYYEGTTDVTRTVSCGSITDEQRLHYTLVLKGLLNFSSCMFPQGCRGSHLDALARVPLWNAGLNYAHGTGHGIGYMLCVHEPPINIRYYAKTSATLREGMMLSVEPGVYIEGSHGVRLENQLLVGKSEGNFLRFETLTLIPFDKNAIDASLLTNEERAALNAYHKNVYEKISPKLGEKERIWLKEATKEI